MTDWDTVADWWQGEVAADPVYREDIEPVLSRLTRTADGPFVDLGCGEGQWLRALDLPGAGFGVDSSRSLLGQARGSGATVVRAVLPGLGWVRNEAVGTAFSVFVLDLIDDYEGFFVETSRIVRSGGSLIVVINHPAFTAPGSGPFMDEDFEAFWRWGSYFGNGASDVPAGSASVTMYHRPTATLLTAAANAGWLLEEMIEAPLGPAAIEREPSYAGQESIPRFLGARWRR